MSDRKSAKRYRRTLSDREARVLSSLAYNGKTIFTPDDVRKFVGETKDFLNNLVRKRWILKIRRGVYVLAPFEAGERGAETFTMHSHVIASLLVKPYYIGYWSALNHHGLTDQTPPAVYIATTRPRHSRRILNTEFRFVTIPKRKMIGIEEVEIEGRKVSFSTPEKTIVDCLDHPEHCGGTEEVAKALYFAKDELDAKKITDFAGKLRNNAVVKRLGYISDAIGLTECSELLSSTELKTGYPLLDPTLPRRGHIKEKWKLLVNAPIDPLRWSR